MVSIIIFKQKISYENSTSFIYIILTTSKMADTGLMKNNYKSNQVMTSKYSQVFFFFSLYFSSPPDVFSICSLLNFAFDKPV